MLENIIQGTKFIFLFEVNEMRKHIHVNQSHIPAKRTETDRLTLDYRQTQIPLDHALGANIASFAFLASRVATVRTF
jgi:hypothetical protein